MAIAISAWFDPLTEARVRDIWQALHERNLCSTLHVGPYRPHMTLGVYQQLDSLPALTLALRQLTEQTAGFDCRFSSLGLFVNERPVVFLAATASEALSSLHVQVHQVLARYGRNPVAHGLPNYWTPHCTLALSLERAKLTPVLDYLLALDLPIVGQINRLGIIETPTEVELDEFPLLPRAEPLN